MPAFEPVEVAVLDPETGGRAADAHLAGDRVDQRERERRVIEGVARQSCQLCQLVPPLADVHDDIGRGGESVVVAIAEPEFRLLVLEGEETALRVVDITIWEVPGDRERYHAGLARLQPQRQSDGAVPGLS